MLVEKEVSSSAVRQVLRDMTLWENLKRSETDFFALHAELSISGLHFILNAAGISQDDRIESSCYSWKPGFERWDKSSQILEKV